MTKDVKADKPKMRITIIHPAIGHRVGEEYIRTWQMEPLPAAAIAGLTPDDVDVRFYDDRTEAIPYEEKTDAVVMSIETYTAKRAYQIASEYRKRGVPVIVGGFHATLMPEEAADYAEAVVIGEAENIWDAVVEDLRHGTLKRRYQAGTRPTLDLIRVDRTILQAKRYLPIRLIETGRGCRFHCEFCAIQTYFERTYRQRPVDRVVEEIRKLRATTKLFFFVDDNFASDIDSAKELLRALIPLKIRWVTQMSINAAYDEEFLQLLSQSGCKLVLIGFESLDDESLRQMGKQFNTMKGGYEHALRNLYRHGINVYGTFVFGYDHDTPASFDAAVEFSIRNNLYIAAFNHLTPFPGTPLYTRLAQEGRLRFDAWWLDDTYRYNDLPFEPLSMKPDEVARHCVKARKQFYSWQSMIKRGVSRVVRSDSLLLRHFIPINYMIGKEVNMRDGYPLGDEDWGGSLLKVR